MCNYAPELFVIPDQLHGTEVDIWQLGVFILELTSGSHPFDGMPQWAMREAILNGEPPKLQGA